MKERGSGERKEEGEWREKGGKRVERGCREEIEWESEKE